MSHGVIDSSTETLASAAGRLQPLDERQLQSPLLTHSGIRSAAHQRCMSAFLTQDEQAMGGWQLSCLLCETLRC